MTSIDRDTAIGDIDQRFADPAAIRVLHEYYRTKHAGDIDALMSCFTPDASYGDATLGWHFADLEALEAGFRQYVPTWVAAGAVSYPTRFLGGPSGGAVAITANPQMLGRDARALVVVDLRGGRIARLVDYWDGRHFGRDLISGMRTPAERFPSGFGEDRVPGGGTGPFAAAAAAIAEGLATGDVDVLARAFSPDIAFEDLTLRVRLHGRPAVTAALARGLGSLPYGPGLVVRHLTGGPRGGALEWVGASGPVPHGATTVGLDERGRVAELTSVWDGSLIADGEHLARITTLLGL
jgi:hypothetical protein